MRLFILLVVLLSGCSKPPATEPSQPSNKVASEQSASTQPSANSLNVDWPVHGLNDAEQRFSTLDQINTGNVEALGLSWYFDMYTRRGIEATPLMIDGTLYVSGSWSMVYALDAKTGELRWFYDPKVDRAWAANACCGVVNRGVAYHHGKVFIGVFDGRLIALDSSTGKVEWEVQTTDTTKPYSITGAPRVIGNNVIIGNGGAEMGVRGYVSAYDVNTGKQAWRFYTVPGNPQDGFEQPELETAAKTWNGEWWKWGGGGTVWDSMAYDPELDLLYIGVGNGSPWNHTLRSPGGGDNLFLSSIVALRPSTGEYVWHYQTTPGESWDFTATQHIILAELNIDGRERKVLMQAPKNGFFYVLDRASGELISAKNYTPMNWATSVDLNTGRPIENPEARDFTQVRTVLPGQGGGHNWQPMSYSPQTALVYLPSMNFPAPYLNPTRAQDRQPGSGRVNLGVEMVLHAPPEIPGIEEILAKTYVGQLQAWDPVTQQVRWSVEHKGIVQSGVLSTAGNLVFQGNGEGQFAAYNASTGEKLWSQDSQTAVLAAPITYAIDGEQYVAVAVGWGGSFATIGGGITSASNFKNRSRVLVYKLGADNTLAALTKTDTAIAKPLAVTVTDAVIQQGKVHYHRHCYFCHGDSAKSGGVIQDLRYSQNLEQAMWEKIVIDGVLNSIGMVSFKEYLSVEDAEAIRQYVLSRANHQYQQQYSE